MQPAKLLIVTAPSRPLIGSVAVGNMRIKIEVAADETINSVHAHLVIVDFEKAIILLFVYFRLNLSGKALLITRYIIPAKPVKNPAKKNQGLVFSHWSSL